MEHCKTLLPVLVLSQEREREEGRGVEAGRRPGSLPLAGWPAQGGGVGEVGKPQASSREAAAVSLNWLPFKYPLRAGFPAPLSS